jgi:hypothetical protein
MDPMDQWIHFSMEKEGERAGLGMPEVPVAVEKLKYRNGLDRKSFK